MNLEFFNSGVYNIFLSSAVMAALLSSVVNYFSARKTNKRLLEIENLKRESELKTYRYTNIFESLKELNNLPDMDYTYLKPDEHGNLIQDKELFGQVVSKAAERYSAVKKIYERTKPIINENFILEVIPAIEEAEKQSNILTKSLYQNRPLPEGVNVVTLMQARQYAETEIKRIMENQVSLLTKSYDYR
jgi:heme exporter protein D